MFLSTINYGKDYIQNNYDSSVINAGPSINYKCSFVPIEKWIEALEETKRLYEVLLKEKDDKNTLLQQIVNL